MNKYEQALDVFQCKEPKPTWFEMVKNIKELNELVAKRNKEIEARKTLEELVKRATPMKPKNIGIGFLDLQYGDCYLCNSTVWEDHIFCHYCGQALDWSDE